MTNHKPCVFRFGEFEVREREFLLVKPDGPVAVEPKAFRVLLFLLRNPGRLIKKDEILDAVWSDTAVSDNSLTRSIATLRRLLGDDSREPRYIATVQTIGYRFLCDVEVIEDRTGKPEFPAPDARNESNNVAAVSQGSDHIAKSSRRITRFLVGGVALAVGLGFLWLIRERLFDRQQITEQQITRNSNDNPVFGAAISGDGKYLAFSDSLGIHVRLLATGETHDFAEPTEFGNTAVFWRISWLPDSARFLATSIRMVNRPLSGRPRCLGPFQDIEDGEVESVSPDGSTVVFLRTLGRQLWLMGANGEMPRKLYDAGDRSYYWNVRWSPDGGRLLYIRFEWSVPDMRRTMETRDLKGGPATTLLADDMIRNLYWLSDGRILYAMGQPGLNSDSCDLWSARVDNKTGRFSEQPTQITHSTGFCMELTSATSDGKQIVFLKYSLEYSAYVADLAPGATRISPPKHLSTTEDREFPAAWTADSQAVIFVSNRNGTWDSTGKR